MNGSTRPGSAKASFEEVWQWLDEGPDPEIPVISLVDLGIIRDLRYDEDTLVVVVTPTYSGCPATSVINQDIEQALRRHGVSELKLERRISPPWTTSWISAKGREKLRSYGIAPPVEDQGNDGGGPRRIWLRTETMSRPEVPCPRCGSMRTDRVSQFGSTPCKANYRCLDCLEPFDHFKCI